MPTTITGLSSVTTTAPSISAVNLTANSDVIAGTSATTASISPSANKLILASVSSRRNDSVDPLAPSLSGNGLTWVQVNSIVYDTSSTSRRTVTTFRALGSSPSAGTVTIDFGANSQDEICWSIDEVTNADTSGTNGSGAIVQSVTNKDETGTATSLTMTLAAFSNTLNATYGVLSNGNGTSETANAGGGFSMLGTAQASTDNLSTYTEFKSTNDTGVDFTWTTGIVAGGIAIEIKNIASNPMTWVV
jgi:hypothetical protein